MLSNAFQTIETIRSFEHKHLIANSLISIKSINWFLGLGCSIDCMFTVVFSHSAFLFHDNRLFNTPN